MQPCHWWLLSGFLIGPADGFKLSADCHEKVSNLEPQCASRRKNTGLTSVCKQQLAQTHRPWGENMEPEQQEHTCRGHPAGSTPPLTFIWKVSPGFRERTLMGSWLELMEWEPLGYCLTCCWLCFNNVNRESWMESLPGNFLLTIKCEVWKRQWQVSKGRNVLHMLFNAIYV